MKKNYSLRYVPSICGGAHQSVMFIHGLWNSGVIWEEWAQQFSSQGYQSWSISMNLSAGNLSIRDYADIVHDAIDHVQLEHGVIPILVGHSMGGLVAQLVASERAIPAMVLVASAAPGISNISWSLVRDLWRYLLQMQYVAAYSRSSIEKYLDLRRVQVKLGSYLPESLRKKLYLDELDPLNLGGMIQEKLPSIGRAVRAFALGTVTVDRMTCPQVLLVAGRRDTVISARVHNALREKYAQSSTIIEHDLGHMVMLDDRSGPLVERILSWLHSQT